MSRAESFLRGGTPCTEISELTEVLSSVGDAYAHWRFVAYYPQRWLNDVVENRTTAPLYFLAFAAATAGTGAGSGSVGTNTRVAHEIDLSAWHLLFYTVLPNGAVPHEMVKCNAVSDSDSSGGALADAKTTTGRCSTADGVTEGGGGVGALRTLLRTLPSGLHPTVSLEWLSVMNGQAYQRMGLMSELLFESIVAPAVAEVVSKCWRPILSASSKEEVHEGGAAAAFAMTSAHYVHNYRCANTFNFVRRNGPPSTLKVKELSNPNDAVEPFVNGVVRAAVEWMSSSQKLRAFTTDASVPPLPEACRALLYPVVSALPPCLYTSLFVEAEHVSAAPCAPLVDPETLTGVAKLRAERDAGIARWKQKLGEYISFTLQDVSTASSTAITTTTARPFQHVILLQRPIEEKRQVDVDNRDPGPLSPQPIGAELHLLQDRGDVQYTLEQLVNRSNIHFSYTDTLPDDGEVLVQLTPVEGTPFSDLEAYFACVPADSPVFTTGSAAQYADSCCGIVVPRVLFRRPTGKTEKANPIATAQAAVEVLPPTAEMVVAAVSALKYISAHVEIIKDGNTTLPSLASSSLTATAAALPRPGYTLKVPPVDLSLVPAKKCGWCGRRREVLLRCGSCKTVLYCCKRHQALDWKEGSHKVECKLWRRARELQEHVVGLWALSKPWTWNAKITNDTHHQQEEKKERKSTVPKGRGWSCAATLMHFIKDVEAETARRGNAQSSANSVNDEILNIHVAGFDSSCLDEFLCASAEQFSAFADLVNDPKHCIQYRILLCADTFTDDQRNTVWAVRRCPGSNDEENFWRTVNTGVLGDTWHCKGCNEAATQSATCVALIRCCGVKYHNFDRGSSSNSGLSGVGERPSAVLSFGPLSGEGCTYLSAALEVFAGRDVGVVPLRLVDSSYVGSARTRDALAARLVSSELCATTTKNRASALVMRAKEKESTEVREGAAQTYVLSGGQQQPFLILFNDSGAVAQEVEAKAIAPNDLDSASLNADTATTIEMRAESTGSAVPHYVNSYVFDVFPSSF